MMTELRAMLQEEMALLPLNRKPALRRAREDAYLLASDLPFLTSEATLQAFREKLERNAWHTSLSDDGWLCFDHAVPLPVEALPAGDAAQVELACLVSLLERHPSPETDAVFLRRLCKVSETGAQALQELLTETHREWAKRLRLHMPLPGTVLPYLMALQGEPSVVCGLIERMEDKHDYQKPGPCQIPV